ncbi:Conserved_hypothetical protein [Hexamita inflata]|uniref:Uncharacterized protein n=1 Tax=Hexamita inflata TaxID=28002 RepID=A0AA86QXQ6_9EUKA|nr:Conserved hypothetical protein [Hexamita inflata]
MASRKPRKRQMRGPIYGLFKVESIYSYTQDEVYNLIMKSQYQFILINMIYMQIYICRSVVKSDQIYIYIYIYALYKNNTSFQIIPIKLYVTHTAKFASGDDEVEYLYKDDGLGFQKVNADGQLVNSDNNIDSSGSKKLQSPQDEQFILDHKHDHTDPNGQGQGQAPFTYCCPYCKNTTDIRADMTQSAFMSISQLNGNNNGNGNHSDYPTYNNPRQLFKTNPRQTTTPATVGVFERLLNKQKEIEKKQQRKRDLFLQERRRTMERILRSLSLFVDTAPIENLTKSFFQVQGASQKLIGLKSAREMTPGSAKQVSYIQAVLNMTDRRPESAVTQKMPTSAKRVEMSKRPMSGNQNNVMQLLQQKK